MAARSRLGIDIGGTFTDAILVDEETGDVRTAKVPSTPDDPARGFLAATRRILAHGQIPPRSVATVIHGTTIATNTVIEGRLARTAFVTTEGFRDLLEIGRQIRPSLYDLQFEKPRPLVPRDRAFEIRERMDAFGNVVTPLDEAAIPALASRIRSAGAESVAVCLLHAHVNPAHERRLGALLREMLPDLPISLSSEIAPEIREYFRASTTVINAGICPVVSRYLRRIAGLLEQDGLNAALLVMQSSGGVATFASAEKKPVFIVESGPAAGVVAATFLGRTLGFPNVLAFDMGGTTAKAGLVEGGRPRVTRDFEVGGVATPGTGDRRGRGYPIRTPVIDLVEIGAGGGSIAWIDSGHRLRVGPASAGADPGPVCYGKGGEEPTVTDANLVLGRLNPAYFLGGEIALDVEAAREAIQRHCAAPLGLDVVSAANAIVEIANSAMTSALRLVSVQRGYDPREFILVAFGGAGPLHANRLAAETGVRAALIPLRPGLTSALGLVVTDLQHELTRTVLARADQIDLDQLADLVRQLEAEGAIALEQDGVARSDTRFVRQADLRYVGQSYELPIDLIDRPINPTTLAELLQRFHREHERRYGYSAPEEPVEVVNLRLIAIGQTAKPRLAKVDLDHRTTAEAQKAIRPVYFSEAGGYVQCPIYDRYRLGVGCLVAGPAVVEEIDSTTVIHPGYQAVVDAFGNLLLTGRSVGIVR